MDNENINKDELLDKALKSIVDRAFNDGVVDDKEWELIHQIEMSIEAYAEGLNRALLDGVITPEETKELEQLRDRILSDASSVAKSDGEIDEEEASILQLLVKIVEKYRID